MQPLVDLADYVKIDFRAPKAVRRNTLRQLESSRAKLVAEKVETEEELRTAFDERFELFQGYFLEVPRMYCRCKRVNGLQRRSLPKAITWPEQREPEAIDEVGGFRPALA
jgi:c-di-GMP-related signal transduction protein